MLLSAFAACRWALVGMPSGSSRPTDLVCGYGEGQILMLMIRAFIT